MKNVTIYRCPVCETIKSHTDKLYAELKNDPDVMVDIVDGDKGEFTVEVDGRRIEGKSGDALRDVSTLASEIRGTSTAPVV